MGAWPLRPLPTATDDQILSHYADGDPVFQWHMDTFDLPTEAEQLASGDEVPAQAYRIGDRTWATQFHLEIDRSEMDLWIDDIGPALETDWHTTSARLRNAAAAHQARHEHQGAEVFRRFVKVARALARPVGPTRRRGLALSSALRHDARLCGHRAGRITVSSGRRGPDLRT